MTGMHVIIAASDFNYGMGMVSRALSVHPTNQIYEGVFLETLENGVQLTCSDGEVTIRTIVPASVSQDGSMLLPAKLLGELVRKLEGDVELMTDQDGRAIIMAQGSRTSLVGMPAEDFPDVADIQSESQTVIPQQKFRDAVSRIIFAISADETRRILTGCLMETYAQEVRFVCLDGFRLAMQRVYCEHTLPKGKEMMSFILPGNLMGELSRMLPESDKPLTLTMSSSHMMASFEQTRVYCPLIQGEYINYKQILPTTWTTAIRINRLALQGAIDRASLVAREGKDNLLKVRVEDRMVTISANAERGTAVEKIDIDFDGSPINIAFNARYLNDIIKNIDTEDMSMRFNTNVSPCVVCPVTGNQYTYLILPVRVVE